MTSWSDDRGASRFLITPFEAVRLTACRVTARILKSEPLSMAVVAALFGCWLHFSLRDFYTDSARLSVRYALARSHCKRGPRSLPPLQCRFSLLPVRVRDK